MAMPKNLFLVRHGQSEGNLVRKQFEQTKDESVYSDLFLGLHESQYKLTELGISQAKKAGEWFKKNNFTDFYRMLVSNNVRAMQTAAHLGLPDALWMMDSNLRERDGGLFNVIPPSHMDSKYEMEQKFYDTQPFLFRPPQGESLADVSMRCKIVLDTLSRECDGKDVIIVNHGHVMRTFKIVLERYSLKMSNDYINSKEESGRVPNCSIIHFTRENPYDPSQGLSSSFGWVRMIRPSGGGEPEDPFVAIERKKFSNEELLEEAEKNRNLL